MRPYSPRLSTLQLVQRIRSNPFVASVDLIPGRRATAFVGARPARLAIRLINREKPDILSLADAKRVWASQPHDYMPVPRFDGDETGSRGLVCAFCGSASRHA